METKICVIRKCAYAALWTRNCRAVGPAGAVEVTLNRQGFCFFHYVDLTLLKLRVKQFASVKGPHGDLIVRES